jgi:hypothetical protein
MSRQFNPIYQSDKRFDLEAVAKVSSLREIPKKRRGSKVSLLELKIPKIFVYCLGASTLTLLH